MLVTTAQTTLFIITLGEAAGVTNNSAFTVTFFKALCDVIFGTNYVSLYVHMYNLRMDSLSPEEKNHKLSFLCVKNTEPMLGSDSGIRNGY